jgi:uncharacterized phage protein (TIGR02220 family)
MERDFKGVWIPKEIWLSKELNIQEKVFLAEIDSLDNEEGCFASNAYFAEFFQLSKNRCSEVIKSLKTKGLITIKYIRENGKKNIDKRVIKVVDKSNRGTRENDRPIRDVEGGYSKKGEDNNTLSNNTTITYKYIVEYLNEKAGTRYKYTSKATQDKIKARCNEGFTIDDFKTVIDKKCIEWLETDMQKFLRPETLFGTKFESYLNQKGSVKNEFGSNNKQNKGKWAGFKPEQVNYGECDFSDPDIM